MAILYLAGNFQPTSVVGGIDSPQKLNRAPPTSSSLDKSGVSVAELNKLSDTEASHVGNIETSENQRIEVSKDEVKNQIEELQQFNQNINRSLKFEVDDELGVTIVRVIDKDTDELIRQFPPEELINLSRRLKELHAQGSENSGVLLQEKV